MIKEKDYSMTNIENTIYLDIGLTRLGYAISKDNELIKYGTFHTSPKECNGARLYSIKVFLSNLIFEYKIEDCLVELPVLAGMNGANLSKVIGLVEMECWVKQITYRTISPKSMKLKLTGKGNASKDEVRFWVAKHLDISSISKKELDTIDAIGLFLVDRKND
jgi:Holliday junction resolvasome RuvABC endonuclease subunit